MYIKDYMATDLITVNPTTSISKANELLNAHDINRLPVVDGDRLVGLVTRNLIIKNSPSDATSLDRHEVAYILDKATVADIMHKHLIVKEPETLLDEAAATMMHENIGELIVEDANGHLAGIITDKDIFKAFIDISGYYTAGTSLVIDLASDRAGVVKDIGEALVETDHNLTHMMVYHLGGAIRIVLHVEAELVDNLTVALTQRGFDVKTVISR